jgi:hypothetical protein
MAFGNLFFILSQLNILRMFANAQQEVSVPPCHSKPRAGILEKSMGARNPVEIGLAYRPAKSRIIDSWAS